jgi:ankyrin repeat protein
MDKIDVVQHFVENELVNLSECLDSEGNTCLHLAAINFNIKIAKIVIKHSIDLLEVKNKQGIDALTISTYNNDNLMFFLFANSLKFSILNINELCKLSIRNENIDILKYLTDKYPDVLVRSVPLH